MMLNDVDLWLRISNALALPSAIGAKTSAFSPQAAVMLLITNELSPQIVFNLRAKHLTYHAGEVCFPGGMWEHQDESLLASALRETEEEIGIPSSHIQLLGALPVRYTRSGTAVAPFVARIPANYSFVINPHELDSIFTVPLVQFMEGLCIRIDRFERNGQYYEVPVYAYQGYEIWGFTAAVTTDFLDIVRAINLGV